MPKGKALPYYGKLGVTSLPSEVKAIWYSRHIEPEPCEPVDTYWPMHTDPELEVWQDFARRLIEATPLTEAEAQVVAMCVLDNCTLREAGEELGGRSPERVRQILEKALRRFRTHQKALTRKDIWELDTRDMTWVWWAHENKRNKQPDTYRT